MRKPRSKPWIVSTRSPLSPGRAERHGFEYYRHGTLSLYAALDTKTGRVHGRTTARHTSRDFVAFLEEVVSLCPPRQQIHIILDNLSAHKTQLVRDFLQQHPRVQFHFTPTYSSWLNQVEIWFAKIEREVIARGIFTSVPDLARKLRRYINAYSANARPIRWKYSTPPAVCALTNSLRNGVGHRRSPRGRGSSRRAVGKVRCRVGEHDKESSLHLRVRRQPDHSCDDTGGICDGDGREEEAPGNRGQEAWRQTGAI